MRHAGVLERVRQSVKEAFAAQGLEPHEDICETILIRDGFYCGRSFTAGNFRAVWFLEENLIKFFHQQRGLLHTMPAYSDEDVVRSAVA